MKTVIQRILAVVTLAAILPTVALPMKRKIEELEGIEETSNENQNKKQKLDKNRPLVIFKNSNDAIILPNDILEKILSFIVNDRSLVIPTQDIKTLSLTSPAFNNKLTEMMHEPFQLLMQCNQTIDDELSQADAQKVRVYLGGFFSKIITTQNINDKALSFLNNFIQNLHARRIFARELINRLDIVEQNLPSQYARNIFANAVVSLLRSVITEDNHEFIRGIFTSLQHEGMLKWALRFVYNEVQESANANTTFIDYNTIVDTIRLRINDLKNQKLNLSGINDMRQFGQQLQNFLTDADELIEPLCSEMLNGAPLLSLDLSWNLIVNVPDFNNLFSLQVLDLHCNGIVTLPDFSNLFSLQWLKLSGNYIVRVPDFSNLSSLQVLILYNNGIVQRRTFTALPKSCDIQWN